MNSTELRGYLTGLILGDGTIDKGISKRVFRIANIHKDFIYKIKEDLESCTNFNITIKEYEAKTDKNNVNHKKYWELRINSHPYFAKKYHYFYDDNRKRRVAKEIYNYLTQKGLANWYMSDGYICLVGKESGFIRNRRVDICTDRYTVQDIDFLRKILKDKFGIETSKVKRGQFYRIRILSRSYETFFNLIKNDIVDSFRYKLYLGYNKKPSYISDEFWNFQCSLQQSANLLTSKVEDEDIV